MYGWIGSKISSEFHSFINDELQSLGLEVSDVPKHISLGSVFEVNNDKDISSFVKKMVNKLSVFSYIVSSVETKDDCVWMNLSINDKLSNIHEELNNSLFEKFGISIKLKNEDNYIFHITIYKNEDQEKLELIKNHFLNLKYNNNHIIDNICYSISDNVNGESPILFDEFKLINKNN